MRALRWLAASSLLLAAGFAGVVLVGLQLALETGILDPAQRAPARVAATTYYRVVLVKGLLPQLGLVIAAALALERRGALHRGVGWRAPALLAASAAVAYALAGPWLLASALPGWPALQMPTLGEKLATGLLMVAAVTAAALAGRRLAGAPRGR